MSAVVDGTHGTFPDLERMVDDGEISRKEASEIRERRFDEASRRKQKYDRNGWPVDMRRWMYE